MMGAQVQRAMVGLEIRSKRKGRQLFSWNTPALVMLFVWSVLPLTATIWFSSQRYNLMQPDRKGFDGWGNYQYLLSDPGLGSAILNTVLLLSSVLILTIGIGAMLAVLFDQEFFGRGAARLLVLSPFFIMPTVSALLWKNLMLHPDNGVLAFLWRSVGLQPIDWFAVAPLQSIILIVSWQWLPFSFLTLLTAVQSLDREQKEAATMDGAGPFAMFRYIIWPHLGRAIAAITMIESVFLLGIFAEIYVTTAGGPGFASTNLSFLIYRYVLMEYDIGGASVAGIFAIVLANMMALLLMRSFARNLDT